MLSCGGCRHWGEHSDQRDEWRQCHRVPNTSAGLYVMPALRASMTALLLERVEPVVAFVTTAQFGCVLFEATE